MTSAPSLSDPDPEPERAVTPPTESTPLIRSTTTPPTDPPLFTCRLLLILSSTYLGTFLGALDSTIIATLSTPISTTFHSMTLFSWLATAYLLSNAACQPISGRLTDLLGRGPGLVFSNVVFAAGNAVCGVAGNEWIMIFGRVVAGIGGGGLMSIGTFLASDLIPLRQRGVVQGIGNVCYGAGAMLGGVLGGYIAETSVGGWRWAFLLQVPFSLMSAGLVWTLVDIPAKISDGDGDGDGNGARVVWRRVDFPGAFLTVGALVTLLAGLNTGGNILPWTHWVPLTAIPAAFVLFGVLIYVEMHAPLPIVPIRLLANRTVAAACLANLTITMTMLSLLFFVPVYLQVLGASATATGTVLLFSPVGVSIFSLSSGIIMKRTGKYWALGVAVTALFVVGSAGTLKFGRETGTAWIKGVFVACGGGYGAMLTVTLLACIAAVDAAEHAAITSATYLFRSVGSTLGITIASAVFQNILRVNLTDIFGRSPAGQKIVEGIMQSIARLDGLSPALRERAVDAYMGAFYWVFVTLFGFSVVGLAAMCMMGEGKLHRTLDRRDEGEDNRQWGRDD